MRRTVLAALAMLNTAACSVAEPVNVSGPAPAPGEAAAAQTEASAEQPCPVLVRFGSYAGGIDTLAAEAVAAALRADRRAGAVTERAWGREGERDLCARPAAAADGRALVKVARDALPGRKLNGYVDILLDGKRVFTTQSSG